MEFVRRWLPEGIPNYNYLISNESWHKWMKKSLKRRAEFLEQKQKRREAEASTTEQIIKHAREIFSTPASKDFFRKHAEKDEKNNAK